MSFAFSLVLGWAFSSFHARALSLSMGCILLRRKAVPDGASLVDILEPTRFETDLRYEVCPDAYSSVPTGHQSLLRA